MARKKKKNGGGGGSPAWMVTYSDMVTLLLTFFVLLLSMADINQIKFTKAIGSLRGALGVLDSKEYEDVLPLDLMAQQNNLNESLQRVYQNIKNRIDNLEVNENIKLVKDRGAVVLRLNDSLLFDSGETALKPRAAPLLREVAQLVRPLHLDMRVEGHTDNVPVSRPGISNWDISIERAVSVVKFLTSRDLLPPSRLSAAGYGDQRPLVRNDSPENRAKNRRVDFYLEQDEHYREQLPYLIDSREQYPF
ncbi:OmpA/MotB family protein [Desulfohalobium retbaense]|uniref:OmpA/MotB domain protein n=1 Tax=Desulfohalobium retbaense (strain ATCC 49708 / DSM 5692 / JCM 16813 / HR100) TaxID=485915 RepID=C8WYW0_DESRD|nr:OmpA family protein [Desulfohalobium retbaense]ACV67876.1 OmpA/MotB domain protein [Desulfohalobium retbaense DSM 5692]